MKLFGDKLFIGGLRFYPTESWDECSCEGCALEYEGICHRLDCDDNEIWVQDEEYINEYGNTNIE